MDAVVKEEKNMIEPKKEVEESVGLKEPKVELIDENEYQHSIPYEYRDYIEQSTEKEPANKKKKRTEQETPFRKKTVECQVCRKMVILDCFKTAVNHAGTHTNFIRYECPVEGCDYKCWPRQNAISHMKYKHKIIKPTLKDVVRIDLSDEENVELRRMVNDCFPEVAQTTRKIEPKVELIDVKIEEEIDEDEYQHLIPYEYQDYIERHAEEQQSVNNRKRPAETTCLKQVECQKCRSTITFHSYTKVENHAATHTNINRYFCPEMECDYKCYVKDSVTRHINKIHKLDSSTRKDVVHIELTAEENEELRQMMNECFPGVERVQRMDPLSKSSKFNCQICNSSITELTWLRTYKRRNHALVHIDVMLYKCIEPGCNFKTKFQCSYRRHQNIIHNNPAKLSQGKIELTMEQKLEVERMIVQCFPELKDDSRDTINKEKKIMEHEEKNVHRRHSCDVCHINIYPSAMISKEFRQSHALTHTDIKLYKCCKENCSYMTGCEVEITKHHESMHQMDIGHLPITEIDLTDEQEIEIKMMMDQCFPEWKNE